MKIPEIDASGLRQYVDCCGVIFFGELDKGKWPKGNRGSKLKNPGRHFGRVHFKYSGTGGVYI